MRKYSDMRNNLNTAFNNADKTVRQMQSAYSQAKSNMDTYQHQKDKLDGKDKKKNESCGIFDSINLI